MNAERAFPSRSAFAEGSGPAAEHRERQGPRSRTAAGVITTPFRRPAHHVPLEAARTRRILTGTNRLSRCESAMVGRTEISCGKSNGEAALKAEQLFFGFQARPSARPPSVGFFRTPRRESEA